jgi:hypothetical protein
MIGKQEAIESVEANYRLPIILYVLPCLSIGRCSWPLFSSYFAHHNMPQWLEGNGMDSGALA